MRQGACRHLPPPRVRDPDTAGVMRHHVDDRAGGLARCRMAALWALNDGLVAGEHAGDVAEVISEDGPRRPRGGTVLWSNGAPSDSICETRVLYSDPVKRHLLLFTTAQRRPLWPNSPLRAAAQGGRGGGGCNADEGTPPAAARKEPALSHPLQARHPLWPRPKPGLRPGPGR